MQRADISRRLLPAVIGRAQARAVHGLGHMVEHPAHRLLTCIGVNLPHTPALIERHPADDRGMVEVPVDKALQRIGDIADFLIAEEVGAWHFAPDQKTHFVRPVVISRVFHLLMLSRSVVSEVQRQLNILPDGFIRRRRDQRIRPVALVKDQALIDRAVVEVDPALFDLHLAHAEVGAHAVLFHSAFGQGDLQIIQAGV